jgi:predicted O-methyltransferase YrrM
MSYGAITFLGSKACGECSVFEFGSGYSTLWWASRAKQVVSCEHDQSWYEQLTKLIPSNVTLLYRELNNSPSYANAIVDHGGTFDIVVIDGRERLACANASLPFLSSRGVLVWDDTDRERYKREFFRYISAGSDRSSSSESALC